MIKWKRKTIRSNEDRKNKMRHQKHSQTPNDIYICKNSVQNEGTEGDWNYKLKANTDYIYVEGNIEDWGSSLLNHQLFDCIYNSRKWWAMLYRSSRRLKVISWRPLGTAQILAPPETLLPITIQTTIMHLPVSMAHRVSLAWQVDSVKKQEKTAQ